MKKLKCDLWLWCRKFCDGLKWVPDNFGNLQSQIESTLCTYFEFWSIAKRDKNIGEAKRQKSRFRYFCFCFDTTATARKCVGMSARRQREWQTLWKARHIVNCSSRYSEGLLTFSRKFIEKFIELAIYKTSKSSVLELSQSPNCGEAGRKAQQKERSPPWLNAFRFALNFCSTLRPKVSQTAKKSENSKNTSRVRKKTKTEQKLKRKVSFRSLALGCSNAGKMTQILAWTRACRHCGPAKSYGTIQAPIAIVNKRYYTIQNLSSAKISETGITMQKHWALLIRGGIFLFLDLSKWFGERGGRSAIHRAHLRRHAISLSCRTSHYDENQNIQLRVYHLFTVGQHKLRSARLCLLKIGGMKNEPATPWLRAFESAKVGGHRRRQPLFAFRTLGGANSFPSRLLPSLSNDIVAIIRRR